MKRPALSKKLDQDQFLDYYYLKEELISFCKEQGLPISGSKQELTDRIVHYLKDGTIQYQSKKEKKKHNVQPLTVDTLIEEGIVCSQIHRAFFQEKIGKKFSFNVTFQKWLKSHAGATYGDAILAYEEIIKQKKHTKTTIDPQFEYNTYIRDFFEDQPGMTIKDAIACWKYKKIQPGKHHYERTDLVCLNKK